MLPSLMLLRMRVYARSKGDARIDTGVVVVIGLVEVMMVAAMAVLASMVVAVVVVAQLGWRSMSSKSW
jgi:hypothetical protein